MAILMLLFMVGCAPPEDMNEECHQFCTQAGSPHGHATANAQAGPARVATWCKCYFDAVHPIPHPAAECGD